MGTRVYHKNAPMETLMDYLLYMREGFLQPFQQCGKTIYLTGFLGGFMYVFIDNIAISLAIHWTFIFLYFILASLDTFMGTSISLYRRKEKFKSELLLKKLVFVCFCLGSAWVCQQMIMVFKNYTLANEIVDVVYIESVLSVLIYGFHTIKIILLIGFILYELTSLREHFVYMGWTEFVAVIDVVIVPFRLLSKFLNEKFNQSVTVNHNELPEVNPEVLPEVEIEDKI